MDEDVIQEMRPHLAAHFRPALLARMTVVPYYPLKKDVISKIVRLKLGKVEERLKNQSSGLFYGQDVVDWVARRCNAEETGARNVDHVIQTQLLPKVSVEMISILGDQSALRGKTLVLGTQEEAIRFAFYDKEQMAELKNKSKRKRQNGRKRRRKRQNGQKKKRMKEPIRQAGRRRKHKIPPRGKKGRLPRLRMARMTTPRTDPPKSLMNRHIGRYHRGTPDGSLYIVRRDFGGSISIRNVTIELHLGMPAWVPGSKVR